MKGRVKYFLTYIKHYLPRNIVSYDFRDAFRYRNALYVHIPKTAGTSISNVLYDGIQPGHYKMEQYCNIFTKYELNKFYKFTVVRNPWDRFVSAYEFLKNGGMNDEDLKWAKNNILRTNSFKSFVYYTYKNKSVLNWRHFVPQVQFIENKQNIKLDCVARYERLNTEFQKITNRLDVKFKLRHDNKTKNRNSYLNYYDKYSKEIIADLYSEDIIKFKYQFHQSN